MFALSKAITNTEHSRDSRLLLRRLLVHAHHVLVRGKFSPQSSVLPTPHIPDIRTFEGTLDLFLLCVVAELGELLNPAAYRKQHRDDRQFEEERLCTIYARGLGRELLTWWRGHLTFIRKGSADFIDGRIMFKQVFAHQVQALAAYKRLAEARNMEAEEPDCTGAAFEAMVMKYFPTLLSSAIPEGACLENFDWQDTRYDVSALISVGRVTEPSSSAWLIQSF
jgi:hypothetical protein